LKIVVSGGSGFLGRHLLNHFSFCDALVIGRTPPKGHQKFIKTLLMNSDDFVPSLLGKDVVIHLAGRAHIMNDKSANPINEFRAINTTGTLNLAEQASLAGVKRFIFISTVKVLGEQSLPGKPFRHDDPPNPQDPYSISKLEAEEGLKEIGKSSEMEIVIIRPPLIYGHAVKGNFLNLMRLCQSSVPLPFGSINNMRSLVSVENLIDLISVCLVHPNAKDKTFMVSDGNDVSTSVLLKRLAEAGDCKSNVFKFPPRLLYFLFRSIRLQATYQKLFGDLQVDIEYTKSELNWQPPFDLVTSLKKCWGKY
jgi:UDP-glucose 4-epimerase